MLEKKTFQKQSLENGIEYKPNWIHHDMIIAVIGYFKKNRNWKKNNPVVRDQFQVTRKLRGLSHKKVNLISWKRDASFVLKFLQRFSGYDCHLMFAKMKTNVAPGKYWTKRRRFHGKVIEKLYIRKNRMLTFLDSCWFLEARLDEIVSTIKIFPSLNACGNTFTIPLII